jgi:hypothetical protein
VPYVLITHAVADYAAWKRVFDDAAPARFAAGERSYQVLCDEHDANMVVHFSSWTSLAEARAFFESPALVTLRERARVHAPQFVYLEQIEHGELSP